MQIAARRHKVHLSRIGVVLLENDWANAKPNKAAYVTATAGICRLKSIVECTATSTVAPTPINGYILSFFLAKMARRDFPASHSPGRRIRERKQRDSAANLNP